MRRSQFFIVVSRIVISFLLSVALYPAHAEEGVEVRAAKVCAGVGQSGWNAQGPLNVDNLSVQGDVNGSISVKRDGVDLGKIDKGTYQDYTKCLFTITELLSHSAGSYEKSSVKVIRPSPDDFGIFIILLASVAGGLVSFLFALKVGHYKNNMYLAKSGLELFGGGVTGFFLSYSFRESPSFLIIAFFGGAAWSQLIQRFRSAITSGVEGALEGGKK